MGGEWKEQLESSVVNPVMVMVTAAWYPQCAALMQVGRMNGTPFIFAVPVMNLV